MLTWTTWARFEPTDSSITWKLSRIWRVCASISSPASSPGVGLTPAVPPIVMKLPALAIWLRADGRGRVGRRARLDHRHANARVEIGFVGDHGTPHRPSPPSTWEGSSLRRGHGEGSES